MDRPVFIRFLPIPPSEEELLFEEIINLIYFELENNSLIKDQETFLHIIKNTIEKTIQDDFR